MTAIRTPDDERPDWLYPPFREGWHYQGATYGQRVEGGVTKPGHSPYSVDWNRRTPGGGWLQDLGDPVLAPQDGTVAEVDKAEGLVLLNHHGGLTRFELRHMQDIRVKPGQKVKRGDRIGSIGDVAGSGRSTAPHLHTVQYARKSTSEPFKRVRMTIEGKPVATSVGDSDTRPESWKPPTPVMLQGPPPKATWESAYKEAAALAEKRGDALEAQKAQTKLATEERDAARRERDSATEAMNRANANLGAVERELEAVKAQLDACQAATPPDCSAIIAERDAAVAALNEETDRAVRAEAVIEAVRRAVTP